MSKYRIRIFSSFSSESANKTNYETVCQAHLIENYGPEDEKEIYITTGDDYTHAIIMNTAMPQLTTKIPKANVIGLAFEPPQFLGINKQFIEYAKQNIGKYYIGSTYDLPLPFVPGYGYMWHNPPPKLSSLIPLASRPNIISMMISEKLNATGHLYRHQIVNQIFNHNLPIDLYGRGCRLYSNRGLDNQLKGEFTEDAIMYTSYQFHICIENFQSDYYMSEKITNPLVHGTVPIYLGAENIEKKFPDSTIVLSGDLSKDMALLVQILINPGVYRKEINQEMVRTEVNLLKKLDEVYS